MMIVGSLEHRVVQKPASMQNLGPEIGHQASALTPCIVITPILVLTVSARGHPLSALAARPSLLI